jgi:ACS family hexuronate transporter-like MFS transporter
MFPKWAVGSIVGFGGMAGALGGMLMQLCAGRIKDLTGSYLVMFIIAGSVYLLAVIAFHLIVPRLQRVEFPSASPPRQTPAP